MLYGTYKGARERVGLIFDCPMHEHCRLGVQFKNPPDGQGPYEPKRASWTVTNVDDFKTLTLSPSIRSLGGDGGCQWHGFIKNGRFETCADAN